MSNKKKWIIAVTLFIIGVICFAVCGNSRAAEPKDPVNTWPSWYITAGALYSEDLGVQGGFAYQFKSGLILNPTLTYTRCDGEAGTVPFTPYHRTYEVPYATGESGHMGVGFSVMIPVGRRERK